MNEIAKRRISELLLMALKNEKMTKATAIKLFEFKHTNYLTWATNEKSWSKCPVKVWEELRKWSNSGLSIAKYCQKREEGINEGPDNSQKDIVKDIKEEKVYDSIRLHGIDIPKSDAWFNTIIWCMNRAAEKGIDMRISINKMSKI